METDSNKKKIIYIAPTWSTFVKEDISLLSKKYYIVPNIYNWSKKPLTPVNIIKQFFFILFHSFKCKAIIISFGGYWSFLPSLIGKVRNIPTFIILNGTDCAAFPELNYGNLRKPWLKLILKKSYQWCSKLLPVSQSLVYNENNYFAEYPIHQGFQYHLPSVKTNYQVIPNGLKISKWEPNKAIIRDQNSFITVLSNGQFFLKGGDLILEMAKKFPSYTFHFIGINDLGKSKIPNNVICHGRLTSQKLKRKLQAATYYFQLSNYEGFGVALCEAMLCQCIPIVSNVNALPEIVGKSGFILKRKNVKHLEKLILSITKNTSNNDLGKIARDRIIINYSQQKRAEAFYKLVD